ncbi:MAG: hypothetical protein ACK4MR_13070, partial [Erythrobacter cryptus]
MRGAGARLRTAQICAFHQALEDKHKKSLGRLSGFAGRSCFSGKTTRRVASVCRTSRRKHIMRKISPKPGCKLAAPHASLGALAVALAAASLIAAPHEARAETCLLDRDNDGVVDAGTDDDGGANDQSGEDTNLACGVGAEASGGFGITAIGRFATANGGNSVAVGNRATAAESGSIAIGGDDDDADFIGAQALQVGSIAIGADAQASGVAAVALGQASSGLGNFSTATGAQAKAEGQQATALGARAEALGDFSTATGTFAKAEGLSANALGGFAQALGNNSTAVGTAARAEGSRATALGGLTEALA